MKVLLVSLTTCFCIVFSMQAMAVSCADVAKMMKKDAVSMKIGKPVDNSWRNLAWLEGHLGKVKGHVRAAMDYPTHKGFVFDKERKSMQHVQQPMRSFTYYTWNCPNSTQSIRVGVDEKGKVRNFGVKE